MLNIALAAIEDANPDALQDVLKGIDFNRKIGQRTLDYLLENGSNADELALYGQEKMGTTWSICKMNMLLHGISHADIRQEDTIREPQHLEDNNELKRFDRGYLEAIIGLPSNLFYGTGIPACILVMNKAGAAARDTVLFINADREYRHTPVRSLVTSNLCTP
jgi:type I restriction-modification system DNA methylase subunit